MLSTGTLRCWGSNGWGQTAEASLAADLPGLSGITTIAAGAFHTCALLSKGTLRCWGDNTSGQTAGGNVGSDLAGIHGAIAISTGYAHTCIVLSGGTFRCWGDTSYGQTADSSVDTDIPGLSGVVAIAAGPGHTCAVLGKATPKDYLGALAKLMPLHEIMPQKPSIAERTTGEVMGEAAEKMPRRNEISREAQDELAFRSHQRAAAAIASGRFEAEVAPVQTPDGKWVHADGLVRADTSMEKLTKLRPAFAKDGTLTAGNSSPLTDGAAAVLERI